jgi:uncharacterized protein (TIGR03435 family)
MTGLLTTHLWQSTIFAVALGLLTLAFRQHGARVRHAIWVVASLKFLVPFSALTALGARFAWLSPFGALRVEDRVMMVATGAAPADAPRAFSSSFPLAEPVVMPPADAASYAVLPSILLLVWAVGAFSVLASWAVRWVRMRQVADSGTRLIDGREVALLRGVEKTLSDGAHSVQPLAIAVTDGPFEPGVFGILNPVLLWPRSLGSRLSDAQIESIFVHELAHVRRRDNLLSAVQTFIQAAFWFHPLVWWIGSRLVHERERACDEDVVRHGSRPHVYAESILRTCQLYLEAPAACVAGVTGADLKRRIEEIMRHRPSQPLGAGRKALLATTAVLAVLGPVAVGALTAPPVRAQSVQLSRVEAPRRIVFHRPNGPFRITNFTVRELIRFGYTLPDEYIIGAPAWIDTERFDIELPWNTDPEAGEVQQLVRNVLALQFGLTTRVEKRAMPAYVLARTGEQLGPRLRPSTGDCTMAPGTGVAGVEPCDLRREPNGFPNNLYVRGVTISQFVEALNRDGLVRLDRPVVDGTGLAGRYDAEFGFARGPHRGRDSLSARMLSAVMNQFGYPDVFDALEQQLGLKLVEQNAPIDVLIVERVTRPTN